MQELCPGCLEKQKQNEQAWKAFKAGEAFLKKHDPLPGWIYDNDDDDSSKKETETGTEKEYLDSSDEAKAAYNARTQLYYYTPPSSAHNTPQSEELCIGCLEKQIEQALEAFLTPLPDWVPPLPNADDSSEEGTKEGDKENNDPNTTKNTKNEKIAPSQVSEQMIINIDNSKSGSNQKSQPHYSPSSIPSDSPSPRAPYLPPPPHNTPPSSSSGDPKENDPSRANLKEGNESRKKEGHKAQKSGESSYSQNANPYTPLLTQKVVHQGLGIFPSSKKRGRSPTTKNGQQPKRKRVCQSQEEAQSSLKEEVSMTKIRARGEQEGKVVRRCLRF